MREMCRIRRMFWTAAVAVFIAAAVHATTPTRALADAAGSLAYVGGDVVVANNSAEGIVIVGGGQISAGPVKGRFGKAEPKGAVNSADTNGTVKGSITVTGNHAKGVTCVGADCSVNSFVQH